MPTSQTFSKERFVFIDDVPLFIYSLYLGLCECSILIGCGESINSGYLDTYGAIKQFQWNCLFTVLNDCAVSEMSGTSQQTE